MRTLLATAAIAAGVIVPATAAWAPQMVAAELAAQRALGYEVCEPHISELPEELVEQGVYADAGATPMYETCKIRFASNVPVEDLNWVAWHETCHLATLNEIFADPISEAMQDPAHEHPLFLGCLDHGPTERGGYRTER